MRGHGSLVNRTRAVGVEEVRSDHKACPRTWKNAEQTQSNRHILGDILVMQMFIQTSSIRTLTRQSLSNSSESQDVEARCQEGISNRDRLPWFQSSTRRSARMKECICAYSDMNNHPRFSCNYYYKHQNEKAPHSMHSLHGQASAVSMRSSSSQQRHCQAQLGSKGDQTCS